MSFNSKFITIIAIISSIYFILIALDISPYIRGPAPYPPEWRWPYLFINTYSKIWGPLVIIFLGLCLFNFLEIKGETYLTKHTFFINTLLVVLHSVFILSVVYFSRAGIGVLFHRIANPGLNGYFTTATKITNLPLFLANYHHNIFDYYMHARAHPPGGVLFHYFVNGIASHVSFFYPLLYHFTPQRDDVLELWNSLKPYEQLGALGSSLIIIFLSSCTIPFIYALSKKMFGSITALRSSTIFMFVSSVILFTPLIDVLFPLFAASSFYYLYTGIQNKNTILYLISAIIMSIGILFGLNMLPVLGMSILFVLLEKNSSDIRISHIIFYVIGFFLIPVLLAIIFHFNYLEVIKKNISEGIAPRSYWIWLVYNIYDFFIFAGIPLLVSFIYMCIEYLRHKTKPNSLTISFISILVLLDILGVSRGEVARLWLPFVPFLVIITCGYLTRQRKIPTHYFTVMLIFQALHVLILQEYWVPLW